jgi:hypothetical protein
MLPYLLQRARVDALLAPKLVEPAEERADVVADHSARLSVYENVGVKEDAHG